MKEPQHHGKESSLAERAGRRLLERGQSLATAESCTGGLIGHRITEIPGSSVYYLGGVVAYSNAAKCSLLGVDEGVVETMGAVSADVALQMAIGARRVFSSFWGIGTTGIAGPGGGTPEKPVGLVFIAVAGPHDHAVERFVFEGTRSEVKQKTAQAALNLMLEQLA